MTVGAPAESDKNEEVPHQRQESIFHKGFLLLTIPTLVTKLWVTTTYFPADQYPSLDEVKKNISLVFTNHHFSQGPIRPNVPAMVEIGGIQIKEKPDPLPEDIKQHLDSAKNGAIFFSLGSTVKSSHVPKEKTKMWFDVLSKLPYKILWKWEEADASGFADNIVYRSFTSIVYHGVPMVCIPLSGDQPDNALNVISEGYGVLLDYIMLV
ncbi:UDP-glucosyltransferase 2-like [Teleopsis dalmanni]|uniref:UDP-glucosyltransferase 2-like n=1 Tax=Teleopsis dalmanni TaxID=139649 RepID=UPI0018CD8622|nr:UDP-glucosyltransferase 2-like [Teleopsis dalmanni]